MSRVRVQTRVTIQCETISNSSFVNEAESGSIASDAGVGGLKILNLSIFLLASTRIF